MLKHISILALILFLVQVGIAQENIIPIPRKSPLEKIETDIGIIKVSVEYSRPSMRGRKIFGELVPYDKIWRTGANINTRITFSGRVIIGDQELAAGAYSIFTKPNPREWEVFFHKEYNKYGVPDTMLVENIMAKITIPISTQNRALETFSINFENVRSDGCSLILSWDQLLVEIPITVSTSRILANSLEQSLEQTADAFAYAAWNYFDIEKDSESALKAIDFSISLIEKDMTYDDWLKTLNPEDWSLPWRYQIKSEMHADLGQTSKALAAAKRSLEIANKLNDADSYIKKNKENIVKWMK